MNMLVRDRIYSTFEITSPLILKLIQTPAFQRLKGISQFGLPSRYYHLDGYSRYEHSIGVYILLNKLGASETEQIAGLLHDISHTAFSHLIDWVIGDSLKEDYQDKRHLSVLQQPEITEILAEYNLTPEIVADYHQFKLLERELPDLCADRVDYVLRESPAQVAPLCLPDLINYRGKIVFTNAKSAAIFGFNFLDRQMTHWAGYEAVTRYVLFSSLLRSALSDGILSVEDFFQTDDIVIDKILHSRNQSHLHVLRVLESKDLSSLPKNETATLKKFRYVDPLILIKKKLVRLSQINQKFKMAVKQTKRLNDLGIYSGIITS